MSSGHYYLKVLPDDEYNNVKSTSADEEYHYVIDDGLEDDAKMKSQDLPVTSLYEHPQLSDIVDSKQQQHSTYQRVIASQRLPDNDPQLTTDTTYDEIPYIPLPPPLRPGWSAELSVVLCRTLWLPKMKSYSTCRAYYTSNFF